MFQIEPLFFIFDCSIHLKVHLFLQDQLLLPGSVNQRRWNRGLGNHPQLLLGVVRAIFLSRFFRQMLKRDFLVFRLDFRLDWFSCYRVVGVGAGERGLACKLPENNQQIGNRGTATLLRGKLPPHRSLGCKQDTQTLSATCCKGEPQLYRVKLDIHY